MGLFRVFYAGIFEGTSQNEAEVLASSHRDQLMHIKTVPTQQDNNKNDSDSRDLVLFDTDESIRELLEDVDPYKDRRIRDLDFDKLYTILRKDCNDGDYIIQTAVKGYVPKERIAVISFNIHQMITEETPELGIVHCIPSFVGTEMANFLKLKGENSLRK